MIEIDLFFHNYHHKYHWSYEELQPLTWGKLATFFYNDLLQKTNLDLIGCEIIGIYDATEQITYQTKEIVYFASYEFQRFFSFEEILKKKQNRYYLLLQGPIQTLLHEDNHSLWYRLILEYLIGVIPPESSIEDISNYSIMKDGLKDIAALIRCNKQLKRMMTSDRFWSQFDFPLEREEMTVFSNCDCRLSIAWKGMGSSGDEDNYWDEYQEEHGLLRITVYKLRWTAKRFSKLRLLYGQLPKAVSELKSFDSSQSAWGRLISTIFPLKQAEESLQNTIQFVNFRSIDSPVFAELDFAKLFMKKLHFLVPSSATSYHFTSFENNSLPLASKASIQPLFSPYGRLIGLEASPIDCRGRRSSGDDPCTRVEGIRFNHTSNSHTREFHFRRIGDARLTFLQYDYADIALSTLERDLCWSNKRSNVLSTKFSNTSSRTLWNLLSNSARGYILYCEYNPYLRHLFELEKQRLKEFCLKYLFSNYRSFHSMRFPCPLLLYIGIPWKEFMFAIADEAEMVQLEQMKVTTSLISKIQNKIDELILETTSWFKHEFRYYIDFLVQPIDIQAIENDLQKGYLVGLNWMFRNLLKHFFNDN